MVVVCPGGVKPKDLPLQLSIFQREHVESTERRHQPGLEVGLGFPYRGQRGVISAWSAQDASARSCMAIGGKFLALDPVRAWTKLGLVAVLLSIWAATLAWL